MRAARDSLGSTPEAADQRNGSISLEVNGQPAGTVQIPLMMMISRFNSSTATGTPRSMMVYFAVCLVTVAVFLVQRRTDRKAR